MRRARANNIAPASAESSKPGEVCLISPLPGVTELVSGHDSSKHVKQSTSEQAAPPTLTCPPNAGRSRANSKTNTQTNRLIIVASIQNELIASLNRQAEIAFTLRQLDRVEAVSKQLEQIHAPIAYFWQGLAAQQQGEGNLDHARKLLEQAVSYAPRNYQARALLILGSVAEYKGDYKAESAFYRLAVRFNTSDLYTAVEGHRALAILKSNAGDHQQSIVLLERVLPLAYRYRASSPFTYLQALNSLAVEYQATGRLREAFELARIATTSPLANIYPEVIETRAEIEQEIQQRERASVIVVVPALKREQRSQQRVIRFKYVEPRARRWRISSTDFTKFKPTIGRAPVIRSIIERVATVAPIHAPPFNQ